MALTSPQAQTIAALKNSTDSRSALPIIAHGDIVGRLVPLSRAKAEIPSVVEALHRWRSVHMKSFLTVFVSDPGRTHDYLTRFSLPDPARILFLIEEGSGRLIGHIGLCSISKDDAEFDNVLRGEPVDHADFMVHAQRTLLGWAFSALDLRLVYLNVLADNSRAVRSYEKVGFKAVSRQSLVRKPIEGGYQLVPEPCTLGEPTSLELLRMELCFASFEHSAVPLMRKPLHKPYRSSK